MELFSDKRHRLGEVMSVHEAELNPHAYLQRLLMSAPREDQPRFMYLGREPVTLIGPVTGRHYHFHFYGEVLAVDRKDATLLARHGQLRPMQPESTF